MATNTISSMSNDCFNTLDELFAYLQFTENQRALLTSIEDNRGRFRVWASNLGALQSSHLSKSLDSRLSGSDMMKETTVLGLQRLKDCTERVSLIVRGEVPNRDFGNRSSKTELEDLIKAMTSAIDHLFSVSILIRRQRPKGRLLDAAAFVPAEQSPDITNIRDRFPKIKQLPWLSKRLGNATAQRRELIKYRQLHWARLAKNRESSAGDTTQLLTADPSDVDTIPTTFQEDENPTPSRKRGEGEERVEQEKEHADARVSIFTSATSFTSQVDEEVGCRVPDLPDISRDGVQLEYDRPFECPYCRTIQRVENRMEWKRHVFSDLKPYVCTFEQCTLSSQLFPTRSEWFQHEKDCHRRGWVCIWCHDATTQFRNLAELEKHLTVGHSGSLTTGQVSMLAELCQRPIKTYDPSACLFCQDWKPRRVSDNTKEFSKHLARHLQGLALDALPLSIEGFEFAKPKAYDETSADSDSESGLEGIRRMPHPPLRRSLTDVGSQAKDTWSMLRGLIKYRSHVQRTITGWRGQTPLSKAADDIEVPRATKDTRLPSTSNLVRDPNDAGETNMLPRAKRSDPNLVIGNDIAVDREVFMVANETWSMLKGLIKYRNHTQRRLEKMRS